MKAIDQRAWWPALVIALGLVLPVCAAGPGELVVGRFSAMPPGETVADWAPMTFRQIPSHTRYQLVVDDGRIVLRGDSRASASGLVRAVSVDLSRLPVLTWRWKVSNTLVKGDVTRKSGDDYAARVYVTFAEDGTSASFLQRARSAAIKMLYGTEPPSAALAYVWGNRGQVGAFHPNAYTDRCFMILVESGPQHLNEWRTARRDVVADYRQAFGTDPPTISGVAVMTDTDNTGESATAWYGDIAFGPRRGD